MAALVIECKDLQQATMLAVFYEKIGEQVADAWLKEQGFSAPYTDVNREGGYKHIDDETETVTIFTVND